MEVAATDQVRMMVVSVVLSLGLCVALGLRGFALILAIVVATAAFYWLGQFLRSVIATPKLGKSRTGDKQLPLARRIHSSR